MDKLTIRQILVGCALTILPILFCIGIVALNKNSNYVCLHNAFPSSSDLEHGARLKFPPSTADIEFQTAGVDRPMGCTTWLKFRISSADYNTFANSTTMKQLSSAFPLKGEAFEIFMGEQGWKLPTSSIAGHAKPEPDEEQWIFVDTNDAQAWIVYVITNNYWL